MLSVRFALDDRADEIDCGTCDDRLRRLRNCDGAGNPDFRAVYGGAVFRRCPRATATAFTATCQRAAARFVEAGVLPRAGGTGRQDARLMRGIDIVVAETRRAAVAREKGRN